MPDNTLPPIIQYLVVGFIALSFLFGYLNNRVASLQIAVLNRWARWLGVSFGLAYLVHRAEWVDRPFWVLAAVFFLVWLLLETLYTWFAISALSQSGLSLFPRFSENSSGEEWPAQKKLVELKDWLTSRGFQRSQALFADVGGGIKVRSSVFQNEDNTIRFQILFVPRSNGDIGFCFSFSSETETGERHLTDNLFMPYGGFYPNNWSVLRKPWCRSVERLYKIHRRRIAKLTLSPYEIDPVDDLNEQQRKLEKTNIEEGFLVPPHLQEELGRITWEGRYRVWKEVWLLNYFGVASKG